MNRALSFLSLCGVAGTLLAASSAAAQCRPDDLLCLEAQVGPGYGILRIGPGDVPVPPPPPAPPPVVVQPQPPTVYVQPQLPPPAPVPPTVYVQPQAPQPIYVQPQYQYPPQYVQPPMYRRVSVMQPYPESSMGLNISAGGMFTDRIGIGGATGSLRIRPNPYIGIDLGLGIYGGQDYNGLDRVEVPLTGDFLVFFNPYNRFQFYALAGVGGSWAHADGHNTLTGLSSNRDLGYVGGELGLGFEWRLNPAFALNFDVRGFIRQRIDSSPTPEFTERFSDGTFHSTDTSGGVVGRVGMTFYWGQ